MVRPVSPGTLMQHAAYDLEHEDKLYLIGAPMRQRAFELETEAHRLAGDIDSAAVAWNSAHPDRMIVIERSTEDLVDTPSARRYQRPSRELILRFLALGQDGAITSLGIVGGGTLGSAGIGINLVLVRDTNGLHWKAVDAAEGILTRNPRLHVLAASGEMLAGWIRMNMDVHSSIQLTPRPSALVQAPDITLADLEQQLQHLATG